VARGFGDLEAVVMDRLWARDGATTVREVFEGLLHESLPLSLVELPLRERTHGM